MERVDTNGQDDALVERPHGWPRVARLIFENAQRYELPGRAAQLAYYLLFSLFPTLLFITILISILPMPSMYDDLLNYARRALPSEAFTIVKSTLQQAADNRPHGLLSISLFATIWAASSGMEAVITSLNIAYQVRKSRSWWQERLMAIALTLGLSSFILLALSIIFFGGSITNYFARTYGFGETFRAFWNWAQWPVAALFVLLGLDLIYYFAPNIKQRWRWVTPGASTAVVLWLLISYGFRIYVTRYSSFNVTYGALGSFMVLMVWLYLSSATILLGGIINGVLVNVDLEDNAKAQ